MDWWQWLLIVVALGAVGMALFELPSLLRYLRIKRM